MEMGPVWQRDRLWLSVGMIKRFIFLSRSTVPLVAIKKGWLSAGAEIIKDFPYLRLVLNRLPSYVSGCCDCDVTAVCLRVPVHLQYSGSVLFIYECQIV